MYASVSLSAADSCASGDVASFGLSMVALRIHAGQHLKEYASFNTARSQTIAISQDFRDVWSNHCI